MSRRSKKSICRLAPWLVSVSLLYLLLNQTQPTVEPPVYPCKMEHVPKVRMHQLTKPSFASINRGPNKTSNGKTAAAKRQTQFLMSNKTLSLTSPTSSMPTTRSSTPSTSLSTTGLHFADITNPHDFRYVINPDATCESRGTNKPSLLVYIHSATSNYKKRRTIRQTWGNRKLLHRYNAVLVFILGITDDVTLMDLIQMESDQYQDIVQEDFIDSYHNLTLKAIGGLKWAVTFCPSATYILKTDDDVLVNIYRLGEFINTVVARISDQRSLLVCYVWEKSEVRRDVGSKWYLSMDEYPNQYFPPYCSGSGYILSKDMAFDLYEVSLRTRVFWVDDIFITGFLMKKLKVKHHQIKAAYVLYASMNVEAMYAKDSNSTLMFFIPPNPSVFHRLWKTMTSDYLLKSSIHTQTVRSRNLTKI